MKVKGCVFYLCLPRDLEVTWAPFRLRQRVDISNITSGLTTCPRARIMSH